MKSIGVMEKIDVIIQSNSITALKSVPVCSAHSKYELFIMVNN